MTHEKNESESTEQSIDISLDAIEIKLGVLKGAIAQIVNSLFTNEQMGFCLLLANDKEITDADYKAYKVTNLCTHHLDMLLSHTINELFEQVLAEATQKMESTKQ